MIAASSVAHAVPQRVQDVFVGNNQVYKLSWKNIIPFSETITVDSVRQMRNIDYTIDTTNGTFTFTNPVSSRSAILAVYGYDTAVAQRSGGGVSIPISLALNDSSTNNVTFNALYHAPNGGTSSDSALSLGLGGQWQTGSNTQFTSKFLYSPDTNTSYGHKASEGSDRSGIALGLTTSSGKLTRVSFGFTQAGSLLDSAAAGGMPLGTRSLTVGTSLNLSPHMAATFDYGQTDHMKGKDGSSGKTAIGLTYDPSARLHLQTNVAQTVDSHQARQTTTNLAMSASPTDKLKIQTQILAVSSANNTHSDSTQVSIADDLNPKLHIQTNLVENNGTGQANTSNAAIALTAHPTEKVSVDASYNTLQSSAVGEHHVLNVAAIVAATPNLTINAGTQQTGQAGVGSSTTAIGLKLAPHNGVGLDASYDTQQTGAAVENHVLNVAAVVAASKSLTLTADTQESAQGGVGTSASAIGFKVAPHNGVDLDAHMQFRDSKDAQTQAAFVHGDFKEADFMTFAASYTARTTTSQDPKSLDGVDSSSAKITLTPQRNVQVYGSYDQNPEQNGRVVSRSAVHGLGAVMQLGLLSLGGGYLWTDNYQSSGPGEALHVDLGLQLAAKSRVTAGYQQALNGMTSGPNGQDIYSLGLQHDLGDKFQLSLNGTVNRPVSQTGTTPPTYDATANLGMKF